MKFKEIKNIYETNVIVLKKLYDLLENNTTEYDKEVVEEAINKIEEEQKDLKIKLRKKSYSNINTKEKSILMNHNTNNISIKEEKEEVKEVKEKKEEIIYNDARIYFDGFKYKLIYNNDKCVREFPILYSNDPSYCYDENILLELKEFDKKNNTNLYYLYIYNDLPVTYNFNKTDKDKRIRNIKKVAKNGKNKSDNIDIIYNRKNKFEKFAIIASIAAVALTTISVSSKKNNKQPDVVPIGNYIETTEDITEDDITNTTTEDIVNDAIDTIEDNKVEDEIPTIESHLQEIDDNKVETNIGDTITINNKIDLYYSSTDNAPVGNSSYLNSNTYKVGLISVVYQNQVVKYIDGPVASLESIKDECASLYGDDVKVFVNLDLLDESGENTITKYVGWIDSDDLYTLNKVKTR